MQSGAIWLGLSCTQLSIKSKVSSKGPFTSTFSNVLKQLMAFKWFQFPFKAPLMTGQLAEVIFMWVVGPQIKKRWRTDRCYAYLDVILQRTLRQTENNHHDRYYLQCKVNCKFSYMTLSAMLLIKTDKHNLTVYRFKQIPTINTLN